QHGVAGDECVGEGRGRPRDRRVVGDRLLEPSAVRVDDHDVHVGHRAEHADVLAPPVAVTDDGYPYFVLLRHRSPRPCDASPKYGGADAAPPTQRPRNCGSPDGSDAVPLIVANRAGEILRSGTRRLLWLPGE